MLFGVFFVVVGSIGLVRLPDIYNRLHSVTKSSTLGVIGILAASIIYFTVKQPSFSIKQLATIFFVFLSAPVGAHMIGRAAHRVGVPLWEKSVRDDLKGKYDPVERHE